jgi:hypothetical protein
MYKKVAATHSISTALSTGTKMLVGHAFDPDDGSNAWGCIMDGLDGSRLEFCLSNEAFLTFVAGVHKLHDDMQND